MFWSKTRPTLNVCSSNAKIEISHADLELQLAHGPSQLCKDERWYLVTSQFAYCAQL